MAKRLPPSILAAMLALPCCKGGAAPEERHLVTKDAIAPIAADADPVTDAGGRPLRATFDRRVRLLGIKAPAEVEPGERAALTLFFEVLDEVMAEPKVFVHGRAPGAEVNQVGADHAPVAGKRPAAEWKRGDVLVDSFTLPVPHGFVGDRILVHTGLYEDDHRWPVSDGEHDGKDRVLVAEIPVKGGTGELPKLTAARRKGNIALDGVLDEADWARTQRAGPFVAYDGKRRVKNPTFVRVLWDSENLWVGFECSDSDIHSPYTKRDDPLYESEAVEVFVDADGDKDVYVELQSAPHDVHFDAAFAGGRRQGFDTSYDVAFETKSSLKGTFNDERDTDEGWVSEWRIPIAELRDVPRVPVAGDEWKVNFFRLDRLRREGRVVASEASAWSTPLSGDFHNLDRFGTLVFGDD